VSPSTLAKTAWQADVDDAVAALSAAPDRRVAVAGAEGSLTLLSADGVIEHRQMLSLGCLTVKWSPAGDRIAVGSVHGVDILDAKGAVVGSRHGGWCSSTTWSPDGARLAAGVGRTVVVLDSDGAELFSHDRASTVTAVGWIKNRVASAAYGGIVVNYASRTSPADVMPFTGSLLALAISPDLRWAASGNQDATLHVWRIGKMGDELEMSGYPTKVSALTFSPDSALLATGGSSEVTIWDFTGRGPRRSTPRVLRAHDEVVTSLAWSADGERLAGSSVDGRVAVWAPRRAVPGCPLTAIDSLTRESPATAIDWDSAGYLLAGWADATVAAHLPDAGGH
jgi:WD40 repeat protein